MRDWLKSRPLLMLLGILSLLQCSSTAAIRLCMVLRHDSWYRMSEKAVDGVDGVWRRGFEDTPASKHTDSYDKIQHVSHVSLYYYNLQCKSHRTKVHPPGQDGQKPPPMDDAGLVSSYRIHLQNISSTVVNQLKHELMHYLQISWQQAITIIMVATNK